MSQSPFITEVLTDLKQQYVELVDDAKAFYQEYDTLYGLYAKEVARIEEINLQVATIQAYKKEHGVYPQIKDQPNAESYLTELMEIKDKAEHNLRTLEPSVIEGFQRRRKHIQAISDAIIEHVVKEKDLNKFLTTIMLRAPLEQDHTRCANNEKTKPLYVAAMAGKFLMQLADNGLIEDDFILARVPKWVSNKDNPKQQELDPEMLEDFKVYVLQPVVQAALIHNIGSYSIEAERVYCGNRYRALDEPDRKELVRFIYDNTLNYLKYGLGDPAVKPDPNLSEEEQELEQESYRLLQTFLANYSKALHPLGNVVRIPMIYSSFMLSTKANHNFLILFKAYDILSSGISKAVIHADYAKAFKKMVGRYPLGTGIFFISKETHVPERAVVIGLNPSTPHCAIVKQLTRRQLQFDDHTQVQVSADFNLANEAARKASDFGPKYYKKQFPRGFFWNPAELWERDIDQQRFWRRDNQLKEN